jgi:hypothetical protein
MKPVRELVSGYTYESMLFASQMCDIPVSQIKKSIATGDALKNKKGKKCKFIFLSPGTPSSAPGPTKKFPFGKYRGEKIARCKDLEYLEWLVKQDFVHARLRRPLKERISILK